jgi:hypothetical protein
MRPRPDDTKDAHPMPNLRLQDKVVEMPRPHDIRNPPPVPGLRPQADTTRSVEVVARPPPTLRPVVSNFRPSQQLPFIKSFEGLFPQKYDDDSHFLYD